MFWPCFNPNSEAGVDGIAQRLDAQGFAPTKAVLNCNTAEEAQRPERQSAAARPPLQLRSSGLRFQFGTLKRGPILPRSVPAEYRDRWIGGLWQYLENHEIHETHEKDLFSCVLCISWFHLSLFSAASQAFLRRLRRNKKNGRPGKPPVARQSK